MVYSLKLGRSTCPDPRPAPLLCQIIIVCPGWLSSLSSQTQPLSSQESSKAETVGPGDPLTRVLKGWKRSFGLGLLHWEFTPTLREKP